MKPISTIRTVGIYGAPRGQEAHIGGLPYYRERDEELGTSIVWSEWQFDAEDLAALKNGGVLNIGIVGMEPIPPISLRIMPPDADTSAT